jgi:hypothetical protein
LKRASCSHHTQAEGAPGALAPLADAVAALRRGQRLRWLRLEMWEALNIQREDYLHNPGDDGDGKRQPVGERERLANALFGA